MHRRLIGILLRKQCLKYEMSMNVKTSNICLFFTGISRQLTGTVVLVIIKMLLYDLILFSSIKTFVCKTFGYLFI